MKNFIKLFYGPASTTGGADPASLAIGATISGAQSLLGLIQTFGAKKKAQRTFEQRKKNPYLMPSEIKEIESATAYSAQTGYDPTTLNYLTNSADRAFATNTGTALRLGADPNIISGLDDQYLQSIMNIGSNNAMLQLQKFDKFINAKQLVAANKDAEWQFQDNLLKDQAQSAASQAQAGQQNLQSGVNLGLQVATSYGASQLYNNYLNTANKVNKPPAWQPPAYEPGQYSPGGIYGPPNPNLMIMGGPNG